MAKKFQLKLWHLIVMLIILGFMLNSRAANIGVGRAATITEIEVDKKGSFYVAELTVAGGLAEGLRTRYLAIDNEDKIKEGVYIDFSVNKQQCIWDIATREMPSLYLWKVFYETRQLPLIQSCNKKCQEKFLQEDCFVDYTLNVPMEYIHFKELSSSGILPLYKCACVAAKDKTQLGSYVDPQTTTIIQIDVIIDGQKQPPILLDVTKESVKSIENWGRVVWEGDLLGIGDCDNYAGQYIPAYKGGNWVLISKTVANNHREDHRNFLNDWKDIDLNDWKTYSELKEELAILKTSYETALIEKTQAGVYLYNERSLTNGQLVGTLKPEAIVRRPRVSVYLDANLVEKPSQVEHEGIPKFITNPVTGCFETGAQGADGEGIITVQLQNTANDWGEFLISGTCTNGFAVRTVSNLKIDAGKTTNVELKLTGQTNVQKKIGKCTLTAKSGDNMATIDVVTCVTGIESCSTGNQKCEFYSNYDLVVECKDGIKYTEIDRCNHPDKQCKETSTGAKCVAGPPPPPPPPPGDCFTECVEGFTILGVTMPLAEPYCKLKCDGDKIVKYIFWGIIILVILILLIIVAGRGRRGRGRYAPMMGTGGGGGPIQVFTQPVNPQTIGSGADWWMNPQTKGGIGEINPWRRNSWLSRRMIPRRKK